MSRSIPPHGLARAYSQALADERVAVRDILNLYWHGASGIPHIIPIGAGYPIGTGYPINTAGSPTTFWQMCEIANVIFWHWKLTRAQAQATMIQQNYNWIRSVYTDAQLSSADHTKNGMIASALDDATLAVTFFLQVHEVTGDQIALQIAHTLINDTYRYFGDPHGAGAGLLYVTPADPDGGHQGQTSVIEALTALRALEIHRLTGDTALLAKAELSWTAMQTYHLTPASQGLYWCSIDLRPTVNNTPNAGYLKPIMGSGPQYLTTRGSALSYPGGNMAMMALSAELWLQTRDAKYKAVIAPWMAAALRIGAFARATLPAGLPGATPVLAAVRDAWSDWYFAPTFVQHVLSIKASDPTGAWRAVLRNTANSLARQRTPDGHYGMDSSGPEFEVSGKYATWAAQARNGGSPGPHPINEAVPQQAMTTANAVSMIVASAMLEYDAQR